MEHSGQEVQERQRYLSRGQPWHSCRGMMPVGVSEGRWEERQGQGWGERGGYVPGCSEVLLKSLSLNSYPPTETSLVSLPQVRRSGWELMA